MRKLFSILAQTFIVIMVTLSAPSFAAKKKTPPPPAPLCTDQNLLKGSTPTSTGTVTGVLTNIFDNQSYANNAFWDLPNVVKIGPDGAVLFDLGHETEIHSGWIQADNNDIYTLSGSLDGTHYEVITDFQPTMPMGLQTRVNTNIQGKARFLKLTASDGDSWYSVSEMGLYCQTPSPFPPQTTILPSTKTETKPSEQKGLNDYKVTVYKVYIGIAFLVLYALHLYLKKIGKSSYILSSRVVLMGTLAFLAYSSYYNFYNWHFQNDIHSWEVYHYYLGAKYFPELGYNGLYECTTVADSEDGFAARARNRKLRDHRTNTIRPASYVLDNPQLCKANFTEMRWQDFKQDLKWFRGVMAPDRWDSMQKDHGYNPPPVWTTLGRIVGSFYKTTTPDIRALVHLDMTIVLIAFAMIWWAFGWEGCFLALIVWGLNYPSRYYWIGGAFLRYSWFFTAMAGIALLKKGKHIAGGFFMALSTSITIFPLFFLVGPFFQAFQKIIAAKSLKTLSLNQKKFLGSVIVSGMLLFAISIPGTGRGIEAYKEFAHVMTNHMNTPLTNNMGLKTLMAFRFDKVGEKLYDNNRLDPFEIWKQERRDAFDSLKPIYLGILALFLFVLWKTVPTLEIWETTALGCLLIPLFNELTCYYYSFITAAALISYRRPRLALLMLGATLAWLYCEFDFGWFDVKYTYASLVGVLLCGSFLGILYWEEKTKLSTGKKP